MPKRLDELTESALVGYAALHMAFIVIFRNRLPIMPLLCVLAGPGAVLVFEALRPSLNGIAKDWRAT